MSNVELTKEEKLAVDKIRVVLLWLGVRHLKLLISLLVFVFLFGLPGVCSDLGPNDPIPKGYKLYTWGINPPIDVVWEPFKHCYYFVREKKQPESFAIYYPEGLYLAFHEYQKRDRHALGGFKTLTKDLKYMGWFFENEDYKPVEEPSAIWYIRGIKEIR